MQARTDQSMQSAGFVSEYVDELTIAETQWIATPTNVLYAPPERNIFHRAPAMPVSFQSRPELRWRKYAKASQHQKQASNQAECSEARKKNPRPHQIKPISLIFCIRRINLAGIIFSPRTQYRYISGSHSGADAKSAYFKTGGLRGDKRPNLAVFGASFYAHHLKSTLFEYFQATVLDCRYSGR